MSYERLDPNWGVRPKPHKAAGILTMPCDDPKKGPAIVFVHGLGGGPESTWRPMLRCFEKDHEFQGWALDCFGFPTCLLRLPFCPPPPGLRRIAEGLKTFIEERHGERSGITLIAHSLGGLIARQFIVSELRSGKALRIKKLALIAVPSSGSSLASVASTVSFRHLQLRRLARDDEGLQALNDDWEQLNVENGLEVRYILGGCDQAVPHPSALPISGRDNKSMLINEDHRSIIRPKGMDDIRYQTVRRFVLGPRLVRTQPLSSVGHGLAPTAERERPLRERGPDPLFEAYTPNDEPFYVRRSFDDTIQQTLGYGHVWLIGESGVGKSATLRRAAYRNGWHLNHLSLAGYEVASPLALFRSLCVELASAAGAEEVLSQDSSLGDLFLFLKRVLRAFPEDLVIANIVEEMPLGCDELAIFAEIMAKFLSGLIGEPGLYRRVQFALSSIQDVRAAQKPMSAKAHEQIQLVPVDPWSLLDARRLVGILASTLKPELSPESREIIAQSAAGSPRFVKQVFRQWRNGTSAGQTVEQLITRVRQEQPR